MAGVGMKLTRLRPHVLDNSIHKTYKMYVNGAFIRSERGRILPMNDHNGKHVVFVPLQLANDTVIQRWCDWVKDLKSFQDIVEQVAVYCPDVVFLVKNHPIARNPKSSTPLMSANRNIFVVDEFHYKDCLDVADKVLTINSGVGLQAMAWSVPTIVTGRAFYNFEKINQRATSIDDIVGMIKDDFAVSHERSRRFLGITPPEKM